MNSKCPQDAPEFVKRTLCIIGDKYSALILRKLHEKPQHFSDFEKHISGISPRTLSQRLEMLTNEGIIEKAEVKSARPPYQLTQAGIDLDSVIHAMATWGKRYDKAISSS